jgi:DNA-binding LacI/PurR family transcriptional regulator
MNKLRKPPLADRDHKRGDHDLDQPADTSPVLAALENLCVAVGPGGRIPGHVELMGTLNASERAVRAALSQLQEKGRLSRKRGLGTFVADVEPDQTPKSKSIVAIARPDRSFYDRCVELLFTYTELRHLGLVFQPTTESANHESLFTAANEEASGFLVFGYNLVRLAERLHNSGRRTVLVGAPPAGTSLEQACVFNDHKYGGYLMARHLIGLGHRHIASWQVSGADVRLGRRWQGYQRAIAEAKQNGIEVDWDVLGIHDQWESDPRRAAEFFKEANSPTAIAAWNDADAVRLLITLMRSGIDVPGRVSVSGYDDLPEGSLAFPALTTVHHGIEQQIDAAVEMLLSGEPLERRQTVIVPNLVERNSTAPPPG